MESADVRYLRTSLFSQNERARLCERVSFVKSKRVRKYRTKTLSKMKFVYYTAISREVVGKNVYATIPKGNMGYDQSLFLTTVAVEPTFVALF